MRHEVLRIENVTYCESGNLLLNNVHLNVTRGEIVGLLGQNGSGKTALTDVLFHNDKLTSGDIYYYGKKTEIHSYQQARQLGIYCIHGEQTLNPDYDVTENLFLLNQNNGRLLVNKERDRKQAGALLAEYKAGFIANEKVSKLDIVQRLMLLIMKALLHDAALIILDNLFSRLPLETVWRLKEFLDGVTRSGVSFIIYDYRAQSLSTIANRIFVIKNGRIVAECEKELYDENKLSALFIGEIDSRNDFRKAAKVETDNRFELRHYAYGEKTMISTKAGEIIGVCIKSEKARMIVDYSFRNHKIHFGDISIDGKKIRNRLGRPLDRFGIVYIPTFNQMFENMTLFENITLPLYRNLKWPFFTKEKARTKLFFSEIYHKHFFPHSGFGQDSKCKNVPPLIQRKILLFRALAARPKVVVLFDPIDSLDFIASNELLGCIREIADSGISVVIYFLDCTGVMSICSKIYFEEKDHIVQFGNMSFDAEKRIMAYYRGYINS